MPIIDKHEIAIESYRFDEPDPGLRFYAFIYATIPPNEDEGEEMPSRGDLVFRGGNFPTHDEALAFARGWMTHKRSPL